MSAIFISHSSEDKTVCSELVSWLQSQGHRSVFLDFDPELGIPPGRNWEQELYQRLRACRALIVLCSEHSMSSDWCFAEITHARSLGKHVFPVKIGEFHPKPILNDLQILDLTVDPETAYQRLLRGLEEAGLDPADMFDWDGSRPPYPGLLAFQESDVAIFFGREAEIREGIDTLNRMHRFGGARLAVVLGASGSGKSSLVRAGILPRLQQDTENWIVVPPFRPMQSPSKRLATALAGTLARYDVQRDWKSIQDELLEDAAGPESCGGALNGLAEEIRVAAERSEATVLLVIDQFEELLGHETDKQENRLLDYLRAALEAPDAGLMAVVTLRSDFLADFQRRSTLREMQFEGIPVGLLSAEGLVQVVQGPAEIAGVELEPGLVQAIVDDTETDDALPLLAFTLRELWENYGADGVLTIREYKDDLGGINGSIARAANAVLSAKPLTKPEETDLRDALISMVRINEEGQYARRVVRWSDLPKRAYELLERFVKARLLVSSGSADDLFLEVGHEALFRVWDRLKGWLDEDRTKIHLRDSIHRAAQDWVESGREEQLLIHRGGRLDDAEKLTNQRRFVFTAEDREYFDACVALRDAEIQAEQRRRDADQAAETERLEQISERRLLEAQAATDRELSAKRLTRRTRIGALIALVLGAIAAAFGWFGLEQSDVAKQRQLEAENQRDVAEKQSLVMQSRWLSGRAISAAEERYDLALLLAVEASNRRTTFESTSALYLALQKNPRLKKIIHGHIDIIGTGAQPLLSSAVAFHPNENILATIGGDGEDRILVWDLQTGRMIEEYLIPGVSSLDGVVYSPDGKYFIAHDAHFVWTTDWPIKKNWMKLPISSKPQSIAIGHAKNILAMGHDNGEVSLWTIGNWNLLKTLKFKTDRPIMALDVSSNGKFVFAATPGSSRFPGVEIVWNTISGTVIHSKKTTSRGYDAAISDNGRWGAFSFSDGNAKIYGIGKTSLEKYLEFDTDEAVRSIEFSRDNGSLIVATVSGDISVWDLKSKKRKSEQIRHGSEITDISISPNSKMLVTYGQDHSVMLWDISKKRALGRIVTNFGLKAFKEKFSGLFVSPDDSNLILTTDKNIWLIDVDTGKFKKVFRFSVDQSAMDKSGEHIAFSNEKGSLKFLNIKSGKILEKKVSGFVSALNSSPRPFEVIAGLSTGQAAVYDSRSSEVKELFTVEPSAKILALAIGRSGSNFAARTDRGNVWTWRRKDDPLPALLVSGLEGWLGYTSGQYLSFHPNEKSLVFGVIEGFQVWDIETRQNVRKFNFPGFIGQTMSVAYSGSSPFLVLNHPSVLIVKFMGLNFA